MKVLLITLVALYLFWVVVYLLYNRISTHRKSRCQSVPEAATEKTPDEDIIGKSLFDLSHSLPEASRGENQKKAIGNHDIFAASNGENLPVTVPGGENNEPMDIDVPIEYENDDETDVPDDNNEEEEPWLYAGIMLAEGSTFEEMGASIRTVVHHDTAILQEKEQAGGVLIEIRRTDMFEQLVQSAPGREDIVGELVNLHLTAYRKRLAEKTGSTDGIRQVPLDFDIKNFV
ncbi:MAG: hypothetical protein LBI82_04555 [Dysgonamonadaceae bacterium]|jgi:hypothetical protein|nr:hypothetical protein [Dysgonamonadaceae bacterium]